MTHNTTSTTHIGNTPSQKTPSRPARPWALLGLRQRPRWRWTWTGAWLGLLLAGPVQACMCASPALTVDDLLRTADAVAEVRVAREFELKYLISQARCEADALCLDALVRLDAEPASNPLQVLRRANVEAALARLRVLAAGDQPQPALPVVTRAWEVELAALEAASGAPHWDGRHLPALQLQVLRWFKAPPRSSSMPEPQQLLIGTSSMCTAEPALAFGRSYVLPLRQRAVRGEAVSYEVPACADSHALLRMGDELVRTQARDGQATQPYGSYADFVARWGMLPRAVRGAKPEQSKRP